MEEKKKVFFQVSWTEKSPIQPAHIKSKGLNLSRAPEKSFRHSSTVWAFAPDLQEAYRVTTGRTAASDNDYAQFLLQHHVSVLRILVEAPSNDTVITVLTLPDLSSLQEMEAERQEAQKKFNETFRGNLEKRGE